MSADELAAEAAIWDSLVASEKAQQAALRKRLRKVKLPLRHRLEVRWLSFRWRLATRICPEIEERWEDR